MGHNTDHYFLIRFGSILITWIALGGTIASVEKQSTLLSALVLFLLPLALDYFSHQPLQAKNRKRQKIGVCTSVILSSLFVGLSFSGMNFEWLMAIFTKWVLFGTCGFFVYMAMNDLVAYSTIEELEYRRRASEHYRKMRETETLAEKAEYYRGKKGN
ncbi:hypothetical protein [Terribacillus sp. JSM ZJ617]|uniref:hypothetical protein n=1 Tax=Terribacillus sp. JSM ZJ617 TaxID=3342119 RepID=UPI0035A9548D